MLELAITQAALAPDRRRVTREYITAIQTWPAFGQAKRRAEFLETCAVMRGLEEAEALPHTLSAGLVRQALYATSPAAFAAELARRWQEGLQVGDYYATALGLDRVGVPVSVKHLTAFQTRPERRKAHPALNIGPSKLRDLLREYRPAAHLWAARFALHPHADWFPDDWPCPLDHIAELSEWIAGSLASIRLERRSKPLIGPRADLWRVPADVMLPAVNWPAGLRPGVAPLDPAANDLWKLHALLPPTET